MSERHKIILIVDDEKAIADLLASQLREQGFEVDLARDGYEAINLAQARKPDLIILDVMLPKMDGFKVCRLLKYNEDFENVPIIMLTSLTELENKQTGLEVGADAYMNKPYQLSELFAKVKELLASRP